MSKLVIKKIGPIDNLELDISKQFSVVIGEQATGKSTIAKTIAFFNDVSQMIHFGIMQCYEHSKEKFSEKIFDEIKNVLRNRLVGMFGLYSFQDNGFLEYHYDDNIVLTLRSECGNISVLFSNKFSELIFSKVNTIIMPLIMRQASFNDVLFNSYLIGREIEKEITEVSFMFLPACRMSYVMIKDILQVIESGMFKSDLAMKDYLQRIYSYRQNQDNGISEYWQGLCKDDIEFGSSMLVLDKLSSNILHGKYIYHKDGDTIKIDNVENEIPLYYASSGQQEVVWIINLLKEAMLNRKPTFFIVEEPESHLYPKAQIALVKFIAFVTKKLNGGCLITTHSPYVLSGFNLLAHVGRLQSKNIQCSQIEIEDKCSIPFGSLDAYKLEREEYGSILRNIVDKESGMIDILEIDEASAEVNKMTDNLYELEFGNEV